MLKIELEIVTMSRELMAEALKHIAGRVCEGEKGGTVTGEYNPAAVKWDWILRREDYLSSEKEDDEDE